MLPFFLFNACTYFIVFGERISNNYSIFLWFAFIPSFVITCPKNLPSSVRIYIFVGSISCLPTLDWRRFLICPIKNDCHLCSWWPWRLYRLEYFYLFMARGCCLLTFGIFPCISQSKWNFYVTKCSPVCMEKRFFLISFVHVYLVVAFVSI